jgi:RND family efflux transporter MFP subunit
MPDHRLPEGLSVAPRGDEAFRRWRPLPVLLAGLMLALLAGAAWWWLAPQRRGPPPPMAPAVPASRAAITVSLAPVIAAVLARPAIGDGSVAAWQELVIGTETGGLRVVEVGFEEGDTVRRGQLMVRLEEAIPAAQAAQAEAAAEEAEAVLRMAQLDLRRSTELARTDNVARQTLDQRQSAARQAEARLAAARARRDEAAARLAQARIEAPADGLVSRRTVLLGAVAQPGQEMFRLIRDSRLELNARVPELDLARIRPGQTARVTHGDRTIEGQVRALAPVVAGETRLGIVHVALPPGSGLRPGMFARAEFPPADATPVLTVPQEAVVFRQGGPVAFVVPPGSDRAAQRSVATGARRDGRVEVRAGLAAGERVVIAGAGFLADGDIVRVAPDTAAATAAPATAGDARAAGAR